MVTHEHNLKFQKLFIDLLLLNISIFVLLYIPVNGELNNHHDATLYFLQGNLSWIFTLFILTKPAFLIRFGLFTQIRIITKRMILFFISLNIFVYLSIPYKYSFLFLVEFTILFYAAQIIFYRFLHSILKIKIKKGFNTNRVLIVDKNKSTTYMTNIIENNPLLGYNFIGYAARQTNEPNVLGTPEQLKELIVTYKVNTVIALLSYISTENKYKEYLEICNRFGVHFLLYPHNHYRVNSHTNRIAEGELILINPQEIPLDNFILRLLKRFTDLFVSITAILFIFSWLFPIIAFLIKVTSKGPVFFIQQRTGINDKTFRIIKFRSMNLNEHADIRQATFDDERITWVGKFLRRSNLDEFPQFFNVLLGHMSVVGPRPHMLKHTDQYSKLIKFYKIRHFVKPGITGWAQINGYRGETHELWQMEKRVECDLHYIRNWNIWLDVRIIWNTIFQINAYEKRERIRQKFRSPNGKKDLPIVFQHTLNIKEKAT